MVALIGWIIGLVTGMYIARNNEGTVTRREFNDVNLREGTHKKVVRFYKNGQEI